MNLIQTKMYYGTDPQAVGKGRAAFFWSDSEAKRRELMQVKRNSPNTYQSTYQCRPGARTGSIFVADDFCYYEPPPNLVMGQNDLEVRRLLQKGHMVAGAWDTAFSATTVANHTVCVIGCFIPCNKYHRGESVEIYGECESHFDVLILDILREKLAWGDLAGRFRMMHRKWLPSIHLVEQKGAGISLYQSLQSVGIMVEGIDVTESKKTRAIEGTSAGSVQGWFKQHRVAFPKSPPGIEPVPWLHTLETEMKDFTGQKDASDDQVDAIVHLVNYAIRLSQNMPLLPSDWTIDRVDSLMGLEEGIVDVDMPSVPNHMMEAVETLNFIAMAPTFMDDPGKGLCVRCTHNLEGFCEIQRRRVIPFDSCYEYVDEDEDVFKVPIVT